ncbi:MAG: RidA family protein [Nitrospinae bacterium]|nr:RidA family protein [Nitrospinota bacterium]
MKKIINTDNAPKALGPYSQGIISGNLVFCSGQIPLNPATGELNQETIEVATEQCILNLKAVLTEAGSSLEKALKVTIFVTDMRDFKRINEVYGKFFETSKPARACVEVSSLPAGAIIEMDAIAEL